jgi:hypothetical protein
MITAERIHQLTPAQQTLLLERLGHSIREPRIKKSRLTLSVVPTTPLLPKRCEPISPLGFRTSWCRVILFFSARCR